MAGLSALPRPVAPAAFGGILGSTLGVAAVTGALAGVLARHADWPGQHVLAGWLAYAVLGGLVAIVASLRLGGPRFGVANQVTLLRSGLICLIGGALLASGQAPSLSWSLALLIAVALGLDLVDGWLARRLRLASAFGARFDIEIDALLLLILALLVWQTDRVGAWVLAIGGLRYGFVAAGLLRPWLRAELGPSRRRKLICAQQGVTLLVCLLPPVTAAQASATAGLALAMLTLSFAIDVRWLWRRREPTYQPLPEQA